MRHLILLAALSAPLMGCSPPSSPGAAGDASPAGSDGAAAAAESPEQGPSFDPWRSRLDQLLTLELAAKVAGLPANEAEKDFIDGLPQIAYTWPSERRQEYAGMQLAKKNRVAMAHLQSGVTPEFFRSRFAAPSDAERARVDEEAVRQAAERGMDAPAAGAVRDLASALGTVSPSQELPGLGDVAVWETGEHEQVLYLLLNGSSVRMTVDISDNPDTNRDAAVALARELIERL